MRELLEDQVEALGKLRDAVRGGSRRIIMQAPTGWGKTMLASALVSSAREKNKHALFTVPMISLIDQTIENFAAQGIIDVGVIQAMHQMTDWGQPVQVASIQTLQKRTRPKADVVMADEIHRWFKYYEKWFRDPEWQNIPIIGLSASPWTRGLGAYFDTLIVASTIEQLIERGRLSPFRVFAPTHPDLKNVRTSGGDYNEGELGHAMNTSDLVADALQTWLKHAEGRPTLCFAVNRAHAKHLQQQFATAGVPCAYQDAYTKADERRLIRLRFHNGDIKVVFNVGTLTTGVDWDVRCISLCRPTKSHTLMVQMIGRGLRTAPGKKDCIAEGSLVLTDCGLIPIEKVTTEMRVWDGIDWVSHDGVIYQGEREVIEYCGLIATPDHEVWTDVGKETLASCAGRQGRILVTERDGQAVRIGENNFSGSSLQPNSGRNSDFDDPGRVRRLFSPLMDKLLEFGAWSLKGMSTMQSEATCAEMAFTSPWSGEGSVRQYKKQEVQGLWREGDTVSLFISTGGSDLYHGDAGSGSFEASGSGRQQRPLRAWEFEVIDEQRKHVPYSENKKVGVWDVTNAGPLHRFTVSGKLVSNCLILDHSDNHLRLGFVTDIEEMHQGLHNGKTPNANEKVDAIRLPKECPQCHYLKAPKMAVCPSCGFIAQQKVQVEVLPGELRELQRKKKKKRPNINGEKPEVYGQLLWWARDRGYKPGWVANKYKEIFDVWPTGMSYVKPIQPTAEVMKFIQNQNANYGIRKRYLEKKSGTDRYAMTDRDREFIDNVRKEHI